MVRLLADRPVAEVPLHAVYPDDRLIALKVKSFVSLLAAEFRRDPDLCEEPEGVDGDDADPSSRPSRE